MLSRGWALRNTERLVFLLAVAAIVGVVIGYGLCKPRAIRAEKGWRESHAREVTLQGQLSASQSALSELEKKYQLLMSLLKEMASFYPSLATAIADLSVLEDMQQAHYLTRKPHPAHKRAQRLREAARARKDAERRARVLQYQLTYYESAFPWLVDYSGRSTLDLLDELQRRRRGEILEETDNGDDAIKRFVPPNEYAKLSDAERSDLALRRWCESRKTNWQIGRDYERAVGYEFEIAGYTVDYFGAVKGLQDLGRDLIAKKGEKTYLIQCKYWSQSKEIHEKHIFQLIGTAFEYACKRLDRPIQGLDLNGAGIVPLLVTNIRLSETARHAAKMVGVEFKQEHPKKDYPLVKCNVNGRSRIYHLPFDQQYDTTRINTDIGEIYVSTAAEAEKLGFRRARRHFLEA
jgi:Restriction endonuclease